MTDKRYRIQTACPDCGCSATMHLSEEEMKERFGDVPNVEMSCEACMKKYTTEMDSACPEWASDCKLGE